MILSELLVTFLSFQFLPSLWFSHETRTGFMGRLSSSIAQPRVILYPQSYGNSLKVWSYLFACCLSYICTFQRIRWEFVVLPKMFPVSRYVPSFTKSVFLSHIPLVVSLRVLFRLWWYLFVYNVTWKRSWMGRQVIPLSYFSTWDSSALPTDTAWRPLQPL